MNIFIYYEHMEEELDRQTKRERGSFTFSMGPTICDTYQFCGVHMECQKYPLDGTTISDRSTHGGRVKGIYSFALIVIICASNYIGHLSGPWCPHGVWNYPFDGQPSVIGLHIEG